MFIIIKDSSANIHIINSQQVIKISRGNSYGLNHIELNNNTIISTKETLEELNAKLIPLSDKIHFPREHKIQRVKILRQLFNLSLKDAKEWDDEYERIVLNVDKNVGY